MTKAATPRSGQASGEPCDVTVIVAAWNRARLVTRTLDSIAVQTRLPREVIVIDDASTDATAAVVREWAAQHDLPVTLLINSQNKGVAETRNAGMRHATTRFAAFLDSDDVWLPHALDALVTPLEHDAEALVCCADAHVVGGAPGLREGVGEGEGEGEGEGSEAPSTLFASRLNLAADVIPAPSAWPGLYELAQPAELLLLTSIIPTCSAVFRLDAAHAGGLMPDFRTGEDWLFWLALATRGRFLCRLEPVAEVLRHAANLTHRSRDAFTAQEHLRALLRLQDGTLGIALTASQQERIAAAIAQKVRDWRYHLSRQGLSAYWQGLASLEGRATGGRLGHLLADPKSTARAMLSARPYNP